MTVYFVYVVVALILIFVIYIAIKAVERALDAKNKNKTVDENLSQEDSITNELFKLNNLYKSGAISENEFLKAKKKILED